MVLMQDAILMFGGGGGRESRPQYVQNEWSLATEFIKDYTGTVRNYGVSLLCCTRTPADHASYMLA